LQRNTASDLAPHADFPESPDSRQLCCSRGCTKISAWGEFGVWLAAVIWHWQALVTGGVITAALEIWRRLGGPPLSRKWYIVVFIAGYFFIASFLTWRDEHRAIVRDSALASELAILQDHYASRMNEWWTYCEREDKWQALFDAAEATRKEVYEKLRQRSVVEANYFNTPRADEKLPEGLMLKSSQCMISPGVISVYWHRLDRLGEIILRLRRP
jgi:hypothetical protein